MHSLSKSTTRLLLLGIAVAFAAFSGCNDSVLTPTPIDIPPPVGPGPEPPPPPMNPGVMFSWEGTRGILLFPGTQGSRSQIESLDFRLRSLGWPTPTYNVCSEVAAWEGTPWNDGPGAFSEENLDNLQRFLTTTAELGSQVKLNIFCTLRDNLGWMETNAERYTRKIASIASEFDHIVLSIANEPHHPNSKWLKQSGNMRRVRDWARLAGFQGLMGADDKADRVHGFSYQYRSLGFIPEFHPFRNPDPGPGWFDKLQAEHGFAVISEPTAYSTWRKAPNADRERDWCCTDDKAQILAYMRRVEARGMVWFYHSTYYGLEWYGGLAEWIPS